MACMVCVDMVDMTLFSIQVQYFSYVSCISSDTSHLEVRNTKLWYDLLLFKVKVKNNLASISSFVSTLHICYHYCRNCLERRYTMAARRLVVNDTQEILELFRMLLEEEGYEAVLAGFPVQQIGDIEKIKPDLIILDLVFGNQKTGWQMLQMLRMQRSTASIPIIICTAALDLVREQEGYLVSQGVHVVFKHFDIHPLITNLQQLYALHYHTSST